MAKLKIEGMMGGNPVEGIKFYELIEWDKVFDKGLNIEREFPQIDVDALDDPVEKFGQCFHSFPC
jgi:hypothetical protein